MRGSKIKAFLVFCSVIAFSFSSREIQAQSDFGFSIEPYIGFAAGDLSVKDENLVVSDSEFSYLPFGLKIGPKQGSFFYGLDYFRAIFGDFEDANSGTEGTYISQGVSGFVSYNFVFPFRLTLGGMFSYKAELDAKRSSDVIFKGKGYFAGMSLTRFFRLTLNVEYRYVSFDEVEIDGGSNIDLEDSEESFFIISAGFPYDL